MTWEQRVNGLQYLTTGSVSQWAMESLIFDPFWFTEFRHNTTNPEQTILQAGGAGFLAISNNAAKNWTDRTPNLGDPPNSWDDATAPTVNDVIIRQIHGDIHKLDRFIAIAEQPTGTSTQARGWLMSTDDNWLTTDYYHLDSYIAATPTGTTTTQTINGVDNFLTLVSSSLTTSVWYMLTGNNGPWSYHNPLPAWTFSVADDAGDTHEGIIGAETAAKNMKLVEPTTWPTSVAARAVDTEYAQLVWRAHKTTVYAQVAEYGSYSDNGDSMDVLLNLAQAGTPDEVFPLAMDVDNETGARVYITAYVDGWLVLQRRSPETGALLDEFFIDEVTRPQVENKTYFVVPFCLADTSVSDYGNVVFAFGAWPDGATIKKSTDGGVSFGSDIGDSSWTDRVSAFIAVDQNTFYAFLKTATNQSDLWRTTDGGTNWVKIQSSLPVAPEHQCISRHASGALLVGNSDTGPVQAIYLDGNYEGQYVDASGSGSGRLPNQVGGPGGGLSAIIWI